MSRPYILQCGLQWDHALVPTEIREWVRTGVAQSVELFTATGYDTDALYLTPEQGIAPLVEAIKNRKPDGVLIGYGVRGSKEWDVTMLFEDMVNAIVEEAPGAKIFFSTQPNNGVESVKRWVPLRQE